MIGVKRTGCWLILLGLIPLAGQAQEHRKIMAPETVQSDLLGPVQHIQEFSQELGAEKIKTSEKTFNSAGDSLEEKDFDEGKLSGISRCTYDPVSGTLLSCEDLDEKGKVVDTVIYSFDAAQKKITRTTKSPDGKVTDVDVTGYDGKGLEVEGRETDGEGKLVETYLAQRNFDGKETTVQFGGPDGKPETRIEVQWDPKGYELKETVSFLGEDKSTTLNEYSEFKLDSHGNWIERKVVSTTKAKGEKIEPVTSMESRIIEYFEK